MKPRSSEKEQLIAELRQQLYDLRNEDRDYRGVNDEIFTLENRFRVINEDMARAEQENRNRINRATDEIEAARQQLDDLKKALQEKNRQNTDLAEEQMRCKKTLDEKYSEAGRLRDEALAKGK